MTPTLMSGDAVGNDVFGMYEALKAAGYDTRLFAESWTIKEPKVECVTEIREFLKSPTDLLIYHFSMGWEPGLELLKDGAFRVAVKYHNVTPPEFFDGVSESHVEMCRRGRAEINEIARSGCDLYLSASEYNMRELIAAGAPESRSFVVHPFHHIDRLHSIEPDLSVLDAYRDGRVNILMVGRLSPNKGHAALIEAFANYNYHYNANSRLLIVGKDEFEAYSAPLRRAVSHLALEDDVVFTGAVTDAALKAYYMSAHVFMMTSEHEGFCVPLVEAMAMKIPIVARSSSAIPLTVGDAGLVWDERDPLLLAESVDCLVLDERLRAALSERGFERYERNFTNEKIKRDFFQALSRIL